DAEWGRRMPAAGEQSCDVGALEGLRHLSTRFPKDRDRRRIRRRIRVDEVYAVRRSGDDMVGVFGRDEREPTAVEANFIQLLEVRVPERLLLATSHEIDLSLFFVHAHDVVDVPFSRRDLILELPRR